MSDPMSALQNWGVQTIVFAIYFRKDPKPDDVPEIEQARRAAIEARQVCKQFWQESQSLNLDTDRFSKSFAKKVFLWVDQNVDLQR